MRKSSYSYRKDDKTTSRFRLLTELNASCVQVIPTKKVFLSGTAFGFKCEITPAGLPNQWVQVEFKSWNLNSPSVTASPFPESPHRFGDGRLCMWHPNDPAELRWTWKDGGDALIAHICAHLIREYWWKETGEWPGPEAPHSKELQTSVAATPLSLIVEAEVLPLQQTIGAVS